MIQNIHLREILKLSVEERILAMGEILDSIEYDKSISINPEQLILLERRIEDFRRNPSIAITWNDAKKRIAASRIR